MWRKHGSLLAWEATSVLPQRLLALQLTATWVGVGWQKVILEGWQGGSVLAYSFIERWATPPAWWVARRHLPLWMYDGMVNIVKVWEVFLPFGLWSRRWRGWCILGIALFTTSIAAFLGIWWFVALVPMSIVFYEPEEVCKRVERMTRMKKMKKMKRESGGRIR